MATEVIRMKPTEAAEPNPANPKRRAAWLCLASAMVSAALLWACFHPLAWGTYLGWIALVPFLVLVRCQARPRFVYFCAWLSGVLFFLPALQWLRVADYRMNASWILLSIYCGFYFPCAVWLVRCMERWRIPLVVSFPLAWVGLEYCRSFMLTGFAWYYLAHTQHDFLSIIQVTDLGGIYLVTFLVAAVNAFLFDCAYQFPEARAWFDQAELEPHRYYCSLEVLNRSFFAEMLLRRNLFLEGIVLAAVLGGAFAYGEYRLKQTEFYAGPTVCMLQSNLDQRIREYSSRTDKESTAETATKHYAALCARASSLRPDLIIWPETSFPLPWFEVSRDLPIAKVPAEWRDNENYVRARLFELGMAYTGIPHLLGMNVYRLDQDAKEAHFNSAVYLNATGEVGNRFDKIHPVPFGEYLPLKDWIPFMNLLAPYEGDYGIRPGTHFTRFPINKHHFGVLICYEDTDPFLARRYVEQSDDGPPVDFLVNISNDGWFDGSTEHEEHLVVCRFRAIECRRAMVRSVNMGISALIDSNGRILKPMPHPEGTPPIWVVREAQGNFLQLPMSEWSQFKKTAGVLYAIVPIDKRQSFYVLAGDWLPIGCWLSFAVLAGWAFVQRRRSAVVRAA